MVTGREQETTGSALPEPGVLAEDTAKGRVGIVLMSTAKYVHLRPLGGGDQWDAEPDQVRRLSAREELSARLAWRNAVSRWGR